MAPLTPGRHTHEQWLGLVQPVGLVVAPAVLAKLDLYPNQGTAYLSARQRQLEGLLEEVEGPDGQLLQVVPSFQLLAAELLVTSANLSESAQFDNCELGIHFPNGNRADAVWQHFARLIQRQPPALVPIEEPLRPPGPQDHGRQ